MCYVEASTAAMLKRYFATKDCSDGVNGDTLSIPRFAYRWRELVDFLQRLHYVLEQSDGAVLERFNSRTK